MLNQLFVLTSAEQVAAVLSNTLPGACPIEEFRQTQEALEGGAYGDTCTLVIPAGHASAAFVIAGNYLLFQDADGYWQEYRIIQAQRIDGANTNHIMAIGENAAYELLGEFIDDIRPTGTTAGVAVAQALAGTRWELGTADNLGTASCRIYKTSALAGLVAISAAWGGELRYRLSVVGGAIAHRYVDILTRRGSVTGKRFEMQKDLIEIKQTIDTRNLVSALIGRGKGVEVDSEGTEGTAYGRRLEFTDEVWTVPLAKPAGQNWIGDDTVAAAYGPGGRHIKGIVDFDDCIDAAELLQMTYNELQLRKAPQVTYELSAALLEALTGYAHEAVRLGDTVNAINNSVTPAITGQARVIKLDRNLINPIDATLTLGNYLPSIARTVSDLQGSQQAMRDRAGVWDKADAIDINTTSGGALKYTLDLLRTQLASTASGMYTDASGNLIFENATQTKALKLGAGIMALANSKTDGEYDWRAFGTGDGFTADEIVAGKFIADMIQGGMLQSANASSWINMDNGTFSLGGGRLTVNEAGQMTIDFSGTSLEEALAGKVDQGDLDDINQYLAFDPVTGLTLGKNGSNFQITINDALISFKDSGTQVAYVGAQKMFITNAQITNDLEVGNHKIRKFGATNTIVEFIG